MYDRRTQGTVEGALAPSPAVALLGPRQTGKTTLAKSIAASRPASYLALERPSDLAKLADPEAFLEAQGHRLVILDEVQRAPELFRILRGIIDRRRQEGQKAGHFLLLGSARGRLLAQTSESLAGRIAHIEMSALLLEEVSPAEPRAAVDRLWVRGGFPESYGAASADASVAWRLDFIRSYLEHDVGMFAPRVASTTLRRLWTMLANEQGALLSAARLAASLMVSGMSVTRYIELLTDLYLVRRLPPYHVDTGKRLERAPKIYLRDSGLTHALLDLHTYDDVLGHAAVGGSWEGFVIEQLIAAAPLHTVASFYRTARGAEVDLLLQIPKHGLWACEVKRSRAPSLSRGFYTACTDLSPAQRLLVYPGEGTYPIKPDVQVTPLWGAVRSLRALA